MPHPPNPEIEARIVEKMARAECARRKIDPDELCADGGVTAWMVVAKEQQQNFLGSVFEMLLIEKMETAFLETRYAGHSRTIALLQALRSSGLLDAVKALKEIRRLPDARCDEAPTIAAAALAKLGE